MYELRTLQAEKQELLDLKNNITELLSLTEDNEDDENRQSFLQQLNQVKTALADIEKKIGSLSSSDQNATSDQDEYALFMAEMEKEGAISASKNQDCNFNVEAVEGTKCRAPFTYKWGTSYHNAMICSIIKDSNNIQVKVLFINPTHLEMLPCPYYFENDCKFSEEKCKYSHGETVLLSDLQKYIEPNFEEIVIGSKVLVKEDKLWHRARVKKVYNGKCFVQFEIDKKQVEVNLEETMPLSLNEGESSSESEDENESIALEQEADVINFTLMNTPSSALGSWEKHTKGMGSRIMQRMGYITGSGLGKNSDGKVDPVTAVILPPGKSLDHCMKLRENAGGDENLFSAERKLKKMQKKQEMRNKKIYEQESKKVDVFNFINETLSVKSEDKINKEKHRQEIKKETTRNLNIASLQTEESIRKLQRDVEGLKQSLFRDSGSERSKHINRKIWEKQKEIEGLQQKALNIKNEQSNRSDKKKLTIF